MKEDIHTNSGHFYFDWNLNDNAAQYQESQNYQVLKLDIVRSCKEI